MGIVIWLSSTRRWRRVPDASVDCGGSSGRIGAGAGVEQQQVLTAKIAQEAESGDMPPLQYLALHWDARLSKADVQALWWISHNLIKVNDSVLLSAR